jgi:hypothetical protein
MMTAVGAAAKPSGRAWAAMRRSVAIAVVAAAAISSAPASAAEDVQGWTSVTVSGPATAGGRLLLTFDGHARFRDDASRRDVTILRPGLGWRVTPRLDAYGGLALVTIARAGNDVTERRLWQQLSYPITPLAGGVLTGRTRLEQRFRDTGSDTGWRLRHQFRYARPVGGGPVVAVVANETFLGLNEADWGQRSGFDQNRAFIGAALQLAPKARVEGGYMNQFIKVQGADRTHHNLVLNLVLSL